MTRRTPTRGSIWPVTRLAALRSRRLNDPPISSRPPPSSRRLRQSGRLPRRPRLRNRPTELRMRNPDRIDRILELLSRYWEKYPDMRLAQIVGNANNAPHEDPYHMEDDRLEDYLR